MADRPQVTRPPYDRAAPDTNDPVPLPQDPGGAHTKGYSADPRPEVDVPETGPLPLAEEPKGAKIIQPERAGKVRPTGRSEEDTTDDRALGVSDP